MTLTINIAITWHFKFKKHFVLRKMLLFVRDLYFTWPVCGLYEKCCACLVFDMLYKVELWFSLALLYACQVCLYKALGFACWFLLWFDSFSWGLKTHVVFQNNNNNNGLRTANFVLLWIFFGHLDCGFQLRFRVTGLHTNCPPNKLLIFAKLM